MPPHSQRQAIWNKTTGGSNTEDSFPSTKWRHWGRGWCLPYTLSYLFCARFLLKSPLFLLVFYQRGLGYRLAESPSLVSWLEWNYKLMKRFVLAWRDSTGNEVRGFSDQQKEQLDCEREKSQRGSWTDWLRSGVGRCCAGWAVTRRQPFFNFFVFLHGTLHRLLDRLAFCGTSKGRNEESTPTIVSY